MNRLGERRRFLTGAAGFAAWVWLPLLRPGLNAQRTMTPQPRPSPNAPTNQNVPGGLNTLPTSEPVKPPVATVDAEQITAMVRQLCQLAEELKQETDHTNLRNTMPVDFLQRAQQIEKLAKTIRNKAKG